VCLLWRLPITSLQKHTVSPKWWNSKNLEFDNRPAIVFLIEQAIEGTYYCSDNIFYIIILNIKFSIAYDSYENFWIQGYCNSFCSRMGITIIKYGSLYAHKWSKNLLINLFYRIKIIFLIESALSIAIAIDEIV